MTKNNVFPSPQRVLGCTSRETFGEIDNLVNNAGINLKKDAVDVSDLEYNSINLTNQTSVFALTREVARTMIERKRGSIVMISSMAAHGLECDVSRWLLDNKI